MSYGCGNYMCRGDPGFFGNLFRGITHIATGAIGGLLTGGPVGGIIGAIGGTRSAIASNIGSSTLEAGDSSTALTPAIIARHKAVVARGRGIGQPVGPAAGASMAAHPALAAGMGRRRRRMNWANGRALSRAERRMMSFLHHARRFIKLSHPKAVGVHLKLHRKRKRAA